MAIKPLSAWMFSEFEPVGVDLDSTTSVQNYERNQGTAIAKDDELLDRLAVTKDTVFVDLGTGTGSLPIRAAHRGAIVHAVDVSENMIEFSKNQAAVQGVSVEYHHAGFLSYQHSGRADVVTSRSALHQLPDTWKQVALNNIAAMLCAGGSFYLWDAMWSFDASETTEQLPKWIATMAKPASEGFTKEMCSHGSRAGPRTSTSSGFAIRGSPRTERWRVWLKNRRFVPARTGSTASRSPSRSKSANVA
ncbi:MAG: class I SAM-dependent methyltransferase, partial [Pseudomonadota bacterium]